MALHNGFPVLRCHATVVSRWFVIPFEKSLEMVLGTNMKNWMAQTYHFHTFLRPAMFLQLLASAGNTGFRDLLYFIGIMLVPPIQSESLSH